MDKNIGILFNINPNSMMPNAHCFDVSTEGRASQSSTSRWSRENDAQRAVDGRNYDFAFHTEVEDSPWWALQFDKPRMCDSFFIENRKNRKFLHEAESFDVEVSADGEIWESIWPEGTSGTFRNALICLNAPRSIRFFRIQMKKQAALHLASVSVFETSSSMRKNFLFLASRTDGFGERLRAIINSKVLADFFGVSYAVQWRNRIGASRDFHAVQSPELTFSDSYRETTLVPDDFACKHSMVKMDDFASNYRKFGILSKPFEIIQTNQHSLATRIPQIRKYLSGGAARRAFYSIGFADKLESSIRLAKSLPFNENTVAVHLRAGDIVYGRFRFSDRFFGKVVPFPIIDKIMEDLKAEGSEFVIFGQDAELCTIFAEKYDAIFAGKVASDNNLDEFQAAIFEITLMSRCSKIYAGSSGFAQVASLIGNIPLKNFRGYVSDEEFVSIIRDRVDSASDRVSALQKSFALRCACLTGDRLLSEVQKIDLMEEIVSLDPENGFARLILLSYQIHNDADSDAAKFISELTLDPSRGSIFSVVTQKSPEGRMDAEKYVLLLEKALNNGRVSAGPIVALFFWTQGDILRAKKALQSCASSEFSKHPFFLFVEESIRKAS